jgi:hypothetical protein
MNKLNFFLICLLFILISGSKSQSQDKIPSIEVYGNASIKVVPDIINFSLNIETANDNVLTAKNENDRSVNKVLDVLKDKGILEKDIQTGGIKIYKNYISDYENKKFNEYTVNNSIWFALKDVSKYYEITTEIIKIEHVLITNSSFDYSNIIEIRKHAREQALIGAKSKAVEMASLLDQDLGKPLFVSEEPVYDYFPSPFNSVTQQGTQNYTSTSYTLQEGTINVAAKVKVIFELVNRP